MVSTVNNYIYSQPQKLKRQYSQNDKLQFLHSQFFLLETKVLYTVYISNIKNDASVTTYVFHPPLQDEASLWYLHQRHETKHFLNLQIYTLILT